MRSVGYWVPAAASIIAVLIFSLLGLSLYRASIRGAQDAVASQTTITATIVASALASTGQNDLHLTATLAGQDGVAALVQHSASQPTLNAVEYANLSIRRANPQLLGLYYYNHDGIFVLSQVVNPTPQRPHELSITCDTTYAYCLATNPSSGEYLGSPIMQASLASVLQRGGVPTQTLAFDRRSSPFGYLFIIQPIRAQGSATVLGALVAQIDAASLFAPYVAPTAGGVLIVDGVVVIDRTLPSYFNRGLLPVTQRDPALPAAITGGLAQVPVHLDLPAGQAKGIVFGATVVAGRAPIHDTMLQVISYAPARMLPLSAGLLLGAAVLVFMLAAGVGGLSFFLRQHVRRRALNGALPNAEASTRADVSSPADDLVRVPSDGVTALSLHAVRYKYPRSNKVALPEISYTFPIGTTAIVGPNGAGKSTLVKLLTGLLVPDAGSICVQLQGGACLPPEKQHKAVLFQEPSHLHLTIRQNITMCFARTPDEDARIYLALERAGLGKVVKGLPDGIDTLVGAGFGGQIDLSGGQWQRLALARLIYQDAPVMILDEPVASLDPEGERAVFELFSQVAEAKIIIFTTHRYDSIPKGTKIAVLVDGRITESGTHDELLRQQGDYWSLYRTARSGVAHPHQNGQISDLALLTRPF